MVRSRHTGKLEVQLNSFLASALDVRSCVGSLSRRAAVPPENKPQVPTKYEPVWATEQISMFRRINKCWE